MTAASGQFVGQQSQLALLERDLAEVERSRRGRFVLLGGRRRVGKSWLVSEFLRRHRVPAVFYAATPAPSERELVRFADAVGRSTAPAAQLVRSGTSFGSWEALGPTDLVDAWR